MNDDFMEREADAAARTLALLNAQADGLRAELAGLQRELTEAQRELRAARDATLVEANEQLVLAALRADRIAQKAVRSLHDLIHAGQRDVLTNTPNRALMLDRLESGIATARRQEARIAVLFIDLDHFKQVNDTLGHAVGDGVLQLVARRLESLVRGADTVSRHSGDEFVVLLAGVSQASDAASIATKMLSTLAAPSRVSGHALRLSASIGIAIYPEDGGDALTLISRADAAMYRSKRRGPGRFAFHHDPDTRNGTAPGTAPVTVEAPHRVVMPGEFAPAVHEPHHLHELRDANERLVISAMAAQELEAHADAAHRRQITFLAMVAHELRNPLTPILQVAELLHRPPPNDPRLARLQGIIKVQVAHMARLIEDLLDGSRISTGKFRVQRSAVDLAGILGVAAETSRQAMDKRHQHFKMDELPGPLGVQGDPVRLTQIVTNLLDNASKYTQEGGEISLTAAVRDGSITITISDNGIGITAAALPHIFDLFVQDAHAVAVHAGGLGIGLAVVRELVEAHGGTVQASSPGKGLGSKFVVTLPMGESPAASAKE